ncbi:MAG: hypothetical protein LBP79_06760 [Clostridiales bacterium]|jgi:hypothetical protein|nr:hypothetical protein [Clostridiales bacterium]
MAKKKEISGNRKYILKHKDIAVVEVELDDSGSISAFGAVCAEEHLPVGTVSKKGIDFSGIKEWWNGRAIPASREGLKELLDALNMHLPQELLDKSFGLSLSDQYWICPASESVKWSEVNFFYNNFSEDVGNLLFSKIEAQDLNAISLFSPDNTSDGVLKKKWKIVGGKRCLIKGGSGDFRQKIANEVLASRICERLEIPYTNYEIVEVDGDKYSS